MDKEEILDSIEYLNGIIKEFKEAQKFINEVLNKSIDFTERGKYAWAVKDCMPDLDIRISYADDEYFFRNEIEETIEPYLTSLLANYDNTDEYDEFEGCLENLHSNIGSLIIYFEEQIGFLKYELDN